MAGFNHRAGYGILVLAGACTFGPDYEPPAPKLPGRWSQQLAGGLIPGPSRLSTWWETLGDSHLAALIRRAVRGNPDLAAALARIQHAKDSASAQVDATVEDYRDLLTVLQSQVGITFVQLRTIQRRLQILQENIRLQQESRTLAKDRFASGVAAELDVLQAESNLANSQAQIPELELRQAQLTHRLAVLLGEPAGALRAELATPRPLPTLPTSVAVGIPADLLRRRPDVRCAERHLRRAVQEERARRSEAELHYKNTVLLALEEAENAIAAFRSNREQRAAVARVADAARNASRLARDLYKQGLRNFQNVLDAERTLTVATDALVQSEGAEVTALIDLFRALGGGWSLEANPDQERER